MKKFLLQLGAESGVAFVVTFGGVLLATSNGITTAAAAAGAVAGLRAVVGVIVKDVGEKGTPHL